MPLYWTIDSKQRLFTGGGEGVVTFADAMSLLEALAGADALSYRKLFDGRAVQSAMTGEEVLAVCAAIRAYHAQGPVGALAMVGTAEQTVMFARLLGALAGQKAGNLKRNCNFLGCYRVPLPRKGSGPFMPSSIDLADSVGRLRNMSAKARRLAVSATLSADDVVALNQFAAELDREAARLEAQLASPVGMVLPLVPATREGASRVQMPHDDAGKRPSAPACGPIRRRLCSISKTCV